MMQNISSSQMKQIAFIWMQESDSYHCVVQSMSRNNDTGRTPENPKPPISVYSLCMYMYWTSCSPFELSFCAWNFLFKICSKQMLWTVISELSFLLIFCIFWYKTLLTQFMLPNSKFLYGIYLLSWRLSALTHNSDNFCLILMILIRYIRYWLLKIILTPFITTEYKKMPFGFDRFELAAPSNLHRERSPRGVAIHLIWLWDQSLSCHLCKFLLFSPTEDDNSVIHFHFLCRLLWSKCFGYHCHSQTQ